MTSPDETNSGIRAARVAVDEANHRFMSAFSRADAQGLADVHTEDARVLAPGSDIVSGRSAVAEFWLGAIEAGVKRVELKTDELEVFPDNLVETGRATLFDREGSVIDRPKYLVVWKRQVDVWKIHRDTWNSDGLAQADDQLPGEGS